jgi:hypothetical protein
MLTITTLQESRFASLGEWLASFVENVRSPDDQEKVAALIALFIVECGQARAMVGEGSDSHVLFSYPDSPLLIHTGENPISTAVAAKECIVADLDPVDGVILNMGGIEWMMQDGYSLRKGIRVVALHFNYGYKSLTFVTTIRDSDPSSSFVSAVQTDMPIDSPFEGWARWLTPIELKNAI